VTVEPGQYLLDGYHTSGISFLTISIAEMGVVVAAKDDRRVVQLNDADNNRVFVNFRNLQVIEENYDQ